MIKIAIRDKIKRIAGNECEICKSKGKLNIHHKDKNVQNNDVFNLMLLCPKCHTAQHKEDYLTNKKLCIVCKKEFKPKSGQKFCCEGCRRKWRKVLEIGSEEEFKEMTDKATQIQSINKQLGKNYGIT